MGGYVWAEKADARTLNFTISISTNLVCDLRLRDCLPLPEVLLSLCPFEESLLHYLQCYGRVAGRCGGAREPVASLARGVCVHCT